MKQPRKTKIVCTIGPASDNRETLTKMISSGMDVARLNFSHGTHESHRNLIELIRDVSRETGRSIAILQDLCGPKIRLGVIENSPVTINSGDKFTLTSEDCTGNDSRAHISYSKLAEEVSPGTRILIDDGLLELVVEKIEAPEVICRVVTGGPLNSKKGVNFPETELKIPALTEKDKKDLLFGLGQDIDWIALSFVQRPEDIFEINEIIQAEGKSIPVIAKIEKGEALKHLRKIIDISDGIMVARGDLGVETPFEKVPLMQKRIIQLCREQGKPVITATQMLDSMIRNARPTRAEVNDVANAILDGTDAVMLSGETASGKYPVEAVKVMAKIAATTEPTLPYRKILSEDASEKGILQVISRSACEMAEELNAKAIIVSTSSGRSAKKTSLYRPRSPILALTENDAVARQLNLSWGVTPMVMKEQSTTTNFIKELTIISKKSGLAKEGDLVIISAGYPVGGAGSTNTLQVQILGHTFLRGIGIGESVIVEGELLLAEKEEDFSKIMKGDILAVKHYTHKIEKFLSDLSGLILADENISPEEYKLLEGSEIAVLIGVPGVFTAFSSREKVTIDVHRGIIFK